MSIPLVRQSCLASGLSGTLRIPVNAEKAVASRADYDSQSDFRLRTTERPLAAQRRGSSEVHVEHADRPTRRYWWLVVDVSASKQPVQRADRAAAALSSGSRLRGCYHGCFRRVLHADDSRHDDPSD